MYPIVANLHSTKLVHHWVELGLNTEAKALWKLSNLQPCLTYSILVVTSEPHFVNPNVQDLRPFWGWLFAFFILVAFCCIAGFPSQAHSVLDSSQRRRDMSVINWSLSKISKNITCEPPFPNQDVSCSCKSFLQGLSSPSGGDHKKYDCFHVTFNLWNTAIEGASLPLSYLVPPNVLIMKCSSSKILNMFNITNWDPSQVQASPLKFLPFCIQGTWQHAHAWVLLHVGVCSPTGFLV